MECRSQPRLDRDIERILAERAASGLPPVWASTPLNARAAKTKRSTRAVADLFVDTVVDLDLDLPGRTLRGRLYRRRSDGETAIVFFHGGGFVTGDLDTHDRQARMLCLETGQAVLSVQYRLAPEHPFPAAYDDGVDSVRWTHQHLSMLSGETPLRFVALAGSSAGANLAAGASHALAGSNEAPIAQLLVYPLLGGSDDLPSRTSMSDGYGLTSRTLEWYLSHYLQGPEDRVDTRFAPLLREHNFELQPPAVIAAAHFDPLRDDARLYADRLRSHGIATTYLEFDSLNHAFWGLADRAPAADHAARVMCTKFRHLLDTEVDERSSK